MTDINLNKKTLILSKEEEIVQAMKNCDIEKMDKLIHDDLIFTIPNGQTITKRLDLESYRSGNMKIDEIESEGHVISFIGDNATVAVVIKMKGVFLNQPFEGKFRVLRIWKGIGEDWKIIAGSSVQILD